jgi:hypothetical protein
MTWNYESIRNTILVRWKRHGFDRLLEEEKDYLRVWWLEAEASNGTLHQYFYNSTGDDALETVAALKRLNAPQAASILTDAIAIFVGDYPKDRIVRQNALNQIDSSYEQFSYLTDRLFTESEDVTSLAIDRVGEKYEISGIKEDESTQSTTIRIVALGLLVLIILSLIVGISAIIFSK